MKMKYFLAALIASCLFIASCSGGDEITSPQTTHPAGISGQPAYCAGYWQVVVDTSTSQINAVELRGADQMLNVLGFLEPPALTGLTINFSTLVIDQANKKISVDVMLKHPIPNPVFRGFDVRGVVFGPEILNADGLTPVMAPDHFSDVPFGYSNGLLGTPNSVGGYHADINGYKYFCDGLGLNTDLAAFFSNPANLTGRGSFPDGATLSRHYELGWSDVAQNFFVFNYAVYANYDWPIGNPPPALDDFPISTANSREAFCLKATELENSLYYDSGVGGGEINLSVEVWDWQGNVRDVAIESLDGVVIPKVVVSAPSSPGSGAYSEVYEFLNIDGHPTAAGDLPILITATDPVTFGQAWFLNLMPSSHPMYSVNTYSCIIYNATVSTCPAAVITNINPDNAWSGEIIDNMTISGEFIDGPSLGVKLTLDGESDIIATDVQFVSASNITCDFDLTGAANAAWTLVVTNGCGTPGEFNSFTIGGCTGMGACPTNSITPLSPIGGTSAHQWIGAHCVVTGASGTEYLLSFQVDSWPPTPPYYRTGFLALNGDASLHNEIVTPYGYTYWTPQWYATNSNNRVYYTKSSDSYTIYYIDWTEAAFGALDQPSGFTSTSPWQIMGMTIDDQDRVVVMTYSYSFPNYQVRIQRWNGSSWDITNIPQSIVDANGGYYGFMDIAWDPVTSEYIVTNKAYYSGGNYMGTPTVWAIDTSGNVTWYDDQLYPSIADNDRNFRVGVYIKQSDPDCHFVVLVACNELPNVPTDNPFDPKFIRYNPTYGGKTTGTTATDLNNYFWQCLGEVMYYNGTYYWYDGPWQGGLGRVEMPEWG